jgi:hypothetical protein
MANACLNLCGQQSSTPAFSAMLLISWPQPNSTHRAVVPPREEWGVSILTVFPLGEVPRHHPAGGLAEEDDAALVPFRAAPRAVLDVDPALALVDVSHESAVDNDNGP